MDLSSSLFKDLSKYDEAVKRNKRVAYNKEDIQIAKKQRLTYLIQTIHHAIYEQGFSLIVDDIAAYLNVDEKYVRLNILPHLNYIVLPSGASEAFTPEKNPSMSFVELRIKKWKKVFIEAASFIEFLESHLFLCVPYSTITFDPSKGQYSHVETTEYELPYSKVLHTHLSLTRKCNIAEKVESKKREEFKRKTRNDITHAKQLGLIDSERLKKEMLYLVEQCEKIPMPVHNQEIAKYIEKKKHYRFHLYKNMDIDKRPTVLYWFL